MSANTPETPRKRWPRLLAYGLLLALIVYALAAVVSLYILEPGNRFRTMVLAPLRDMPAFLSSGPGSADGSGQAVELRVLKLLAEESEGVIESAGKIEQKEQVDIVARTAGRLERIFVQKGAVVKRGQALAQLERFPLELQARQQRAAVKGEEAQLRLVQERYNSARQGIERRSKEIARQTTQVKQLRAVLDKARVTFKGQEVLHNAGGISREEYQTARTELISREADYLRAKKELEILEVGFRDSDLRAAGLSVPKNPAARFKQLVDLNTRTEKAEVEVQESRVDSARAELQNTQQLLAEATLRSPITGIVAARNASPGEEVRAGGVSNSQDALLVVVDIDEVYAAVNIREGDVNKVKPGMALRFTVDVFPEEKFQGEVRLIDPVVDDQTHTLGVRAILKNPDLKLRPGMFLRGELITGEKREVVRIPEKAMQPGSGDQGIVFVIREDRVFRVEVTPGKREAGRIEILDGLKADDLIAIEKYALLREGMAVQPVITNAESDSAAKPESQTPAQE